MPEIPNADGWVPVRAAHTDRIIEGAITCEMRDLQGDLIPIPVFVKHIEEIAQNAALIYKHGHDPTRGVVPLSPGMCAYKITDEKVYARYAINKGNSVVDDIWTNEIQPLATRAGFSIGGVIPKAAKECRTERGRRICDISDVVVCEVSWTPAPANPGASVTYVNQLAKTGGVDIPETNEKAEKQVGAIIGAVATVAGALGDRDKNVTTGPSGKVEAEKAGGKPGEAKLEKPDPKKKPPPETDGIDQPIEDRKDEKKEPEDKKEDCGKPCSDKEKKEKELQIKAVEGLERRLEAIYKHFTVPVDAWKAVQGCGTCHDYVEIQVRMGKSLPIAMLKLQAVLDASQKESLKAAQEATEAKSMPDEEMQKQLKALVDEFAAIKKELADVKAQKATVGTGTEPFQGVPWGSPEDINRALNATTKGIDTEAIVVKWLQGRDYRVEKVVKGTPDMKMSQEANPSGIQKTGKVDLEKLSPEARRIYAWRDKQ